MIKFFKNIKNKLYYQYIDKIVNSPENLPPIEVDKTNNTLVIDIVEPQTLKEVSPKKELKVNSSEDLAPKKKPGRPKATTDSKPVKKTVAKKADSKTKPK